MKKYFFGYFVKCILILSGVTLSACTPDAADIQMVGLNYTDKPILTLSVNGYGGASIPPNDGGGGIVCCIGVPHRWRKGMQVRVKWSDNEDDFDAFKVRDVEVPEYGEKDLGFLAIHFYPDDSIKVLVTNTTAEYPGYPYPRPKRGK